MTPDKLIVDFLNYCTKQKGLSSKTTKAYDCDLKQYMLYTNCSSDWLVRSNLNAYLQQLSMNYKPKTVRRKIAVLKTFTHFLLLEDILETDPFDKITATYREPTVLPKTIPLDAVTSLLKTAYDNISEATTPYSKNVALRNAVLIELLFGTGARISEICMLTPSQIDVNSMKLRIYGKGAKERLIFIVNKNVQMLLCQYLELYKVEIAESGFLFVNRARKRLTEQSAREIINKLAAQSGCKLHITPHMFRHTFATSLLDSGADIRYIQEILGHSSIMTTQIYTHVSTTKQKEILSRCDPRMKINL